MTIRDVVPSDFETVFSYVQKLWDYNTYTRETVRPVFDKVLSSPDAFMFLLEDEDKVRGWCHGDYFQTFWMSGSTCYISSLITNEEDRGRGYGRALVEHAVALAKDRGCKAVILDSGIPRIQAHRFYEEFGFEKSCYGFELVF